MEKVLMQVSSPNALLMQENPYICYVLSDLYTYM